MGGGVEILGNPRAVALEVTNQLMFEYAQWLSEERVAAYRVLHSGDHHYWDDDETKKARRPRGVFGGSEPLRQTRRPRLLHSVRTQQTYEGMNAGLRSNADRWNQGAPSASARAALVLAAVGVDWKAPYASLNA